MYRMLSGLFNVPARECVVNKAEIKNEPRRNLYKTFL